MKKLRPIALARQRRSVRYKARGGKLAANGVGQVLTFVGMLASGFELYLRATDHEAPVEVAWYVSWYFWVVVAVVGPMLVLAGVGFLVSLRQSDSTADRAFMHPARKAAHAHPAVGLQALASLDFSRAISTLACTMAWLALRCAGRLLMWCVERA